MVESRREVPVLYVAGSGRSGSTMLERLLCTAPGWFGVGELKYVWRAGFLNDERCGCGASFRECPFWSEVAAEVGVDADRARTTARMIHRHESRRDVARDLVPFRAVRRDPATDGQAREYGEQLAALTDAAVRVSGCEVLVNSSKSPAHARVLAGALGRPVHVVHLVRDSRALAYAWSKKTVNPGKTDGRLMPRYGPARVARDWLVDNVLAESLHQGAASYRRVRYEDLVADPQRILAAIAADLPGSSAGFALQGTSARLGIDHTVHGNPMRFRTGEVVLRPDQEWRSRLPAGPRRSVTALTFPLLRRYGYDVRIRPEEP